MPCLGVARRFTCKSQENEEPTSGLEPLTPAPATSALLAIWVQPNGLLAELLPYPP
jgi:hypothetical protein